MNFHKLLPVILSGAACALHADESMTVKTRDTGAALAQAGELGAELEFVRAEAEKSWRRMVLR